MRDPILRREAEHQQILPIETGNFQLAIKLQLQPNPNFLNGNPIETDKEMLTLTLHTDNIIKCPMDSQYLIEFMFDFDEGCLLFLCYDLFQVEA